MAVICPTVMADNPQQYKAQLERVTPFASRVQVDLTDGHFAEHKTIQSNQAWWPVGVLVDFHLMFAQPIEVVELLAAHRPNLIITHAESEANFSKVAKLCDQHDVKFGVAILPGTSVDYAWPLIKNADHVLIFSGSLGEFGGHANLALADKVSEIRRRLPNIEIGWDGGINDQNVASLVNAGVDVLNVGGFIQNSPDPQKSFSALQRIADETGTT